MRIYKDLHDYLNELEQLNLITYIQEELSPVLEIPALIVEAVRKGLGTLLFENVKGYPGWKVVGNLFGDWRYIKLLFGENPEDIGKRILDLLKVPYGGFIEKLSLLKDVTRLSKYLPKETRSKSYKVEYVGDEVNLNIIPVFKTWPGDAGKFFTYPLVISRDPEHKVYNIGVYRIQVIGRNEALMHWQAHKRGSITEKIYREKGLTKFPVAVAIGGDPILLFSGACPIPRGIDEYLFAGLLRGEGVKVFKSDYSGLYIPTYAEAVLEGYIDLTDYRLEGPFGDHMGYYTPQEYYPVFRVERILLRRDPIYYGTVVGKPPMEDGYIGKAIERIFLPFLKMIFPEIVDINLPIHGLFHGLAVVSIKKRYPGHAKKVMLGLWGLGQFSLNKILIVVDSDVDVHDLNQVVYAISSTVDPKRDVVIIPYTHTDALDHTVSTPLIGSKMGIDATRKYREELGREWPKEIEGYPDDVMRKIEDIVSRLRK